MSKISVKECIKRNVTTTFLLWPLGFNYSELLVGGMEEAFIGNIDTINLKLKDRHVHLVFNIDKLDMDLNVLYANKQFIGEYDWDGYFCLVYDYPPMFAELYDKVIMGTYSKIPEYLVEQWDKPIKHVIGKEYWNKYFEKPLLVRAVKKDPTLMQDVEDEITGKSTFIEYWKEFNYVKEVLDIENYKKQ